MKVFFDWDDVIFNTGLFVESIADIFERRGVSRDIYRETYHQARLIGGDVMKVYNFDAHTDILRQHVPDLDAAALRSEYDALFSDMRRYVFPDVELLLRDLKTQGAGIFIVSFGVEKIQRAKIEGSGLSPLLTEVLVGIGHKSEMIASVSGDSAEDAWFIDDQPKFVADVKTAFPHIGTIQMCRKDGRFANEKNPKSDFVAENMRDVRAIIIP